MYIDSYSDPLGESVCDSGMCSSLLVLLAHTGQSWVCGRREYRSVLSSWHSVTPPWLRRALP